MGGPFDITKEYAVSKKYTIIAVLVAILLIVTYVVIDVVLFVEEVTFSSVGSEIVAYVYPLITMIIMILQFATMALLIKQKFKWINLKLRQIQETWHDFNKENPVETPPNVRAISPFISRNLLISEKTSQNLESLRRRHYELCGISENLNHIYNLPILTTSLNLFISITFTMYFYFVSNSKRKGEKPVLYSVYYGLNGLINCAILLTMVVAASRATNEV